MKDRVCFDCGGTRYAHTRLPHGPICTACRRRRHYHHESCPGCGAIRPLAYLAGALVVCASCAGTESIFACSTCGREDHPYGAKRCARCTLRDRLTDLLTDPATGQIHTRLQPVFHELVGSERPQSGIWWLRKKPGTGPRLLRQMARGDVEISHQTFRNLPSDRAHDYLRSLLTAVGVLPPFEIRIERMLPWIEQTTADLPAEQAALIQRFAHWHVLRHMRRAAGQGRLTQTITDASRRRIRVAIDFLAFLETCGADAATATQELLERYQEHTGRAFSHEHAFIVWLRDSRINTRLVIPAIPRLTPAVTVSEEQRWAAVERLLHDDNLRHYVRIGGLLTLLFAQPLSRIVAMRTSQTTVTDQTVHVTFNTTPVQMPPLLDDLIRQHLQHRGKSLYASRETGWLFPGGNPGRHLSTEAIRSQLVATGIKPYENRKATLFGLAGDIPAPVLADLIGITHKNAAAWAGLAARDWTTYIAQRAH
ncbi:hypothetical protein [Aeromicrobium sp. Sec7.5]|uniref:hypothetical protein n=1 Tax=Aeromicrobium sp. Sec7.5 TaxID=3121276 RepID=UPI002FE4DCE4